MLHIANYQGNINQNHNEMSPHTCQKGCHQKEQMINVGEDTEEALLVNTCVLSNAGIRKNSCKILCPFSSVQSLSHVLLFATPWTAARQASLSSCSLLKLISIESVMPSNHLILCRLLLFLPAIFPSIGIFSNESVLLIRWPKILYIKP